MRYIIIQWSARECALLCALYSRPLPKGRKKKAAEILYGDRASAADRSPRVRTLSDHVDTRRLFSLSSFPLAKARGAFFPCGPICVRENLPHFFFPSGNETRFSYERKERHTKKRDFSHTWLRVRYLRVWCCDTCCHNNMIIGDPSSSYQATHITHVYTSLWSWKKMYFQYMTIFVMYVSSKSTNKIRIYISRTTLTQHQEVQRRIYRVEISILRCYTWFFLFFVYAPVSSPCPCCRFTSPTTHFSNRARTFIFTRRATISDESARLDLRTPRLSSDALITA